MDIAKVELNESKWHKEILEERLKKIEKGEMEFISWER